MASDIDPTIPPDGQRAEKAAFRQNFLAAKEEIEALQEETSLAWLMAKGVIAV